MIVLERKTRQFILALKELEISFCYRPRKRFFTSNAVMIFRDMKPMRVI